MRRMGLQAGLAAVLLAAGWALWSPRAVVGQVSAVSPQAGSETSAPEALTTEGADYCAHLQRKYAEIEQRAAPTRAVPTPAATEAASLSLEGTRMCGHGNTRAGILRLRRALVLMMRSAGEHQEQ